MAKDHPANARQEIDKNPEFYYFSKLFLVLYMRSRVGTNDDINKEYFTWF